MRPDLRKEKFGGQMRFYFFFFKTWFGRGSKLGGGIEGRQARLYAPNPLRFRDWVRAPLYGDRVLGLLRQAVHAEVGHRRGEKHRAAAGARSAQRGSSRAAGFWPSIAELSSRRCRGWVIDFGAAAATTSSKGTPRKGAPLHLRQTSLGRQSPKRVAYAAATAKSPRAGPGRGREAIRSTFFAPGPGSARTHLMHAIWHAIPRPAIPRTRVALTHGPKAFVNRFIQRCGTRIQASSRSRFRKASNVADGRDRARFIWARRRAQGRVLFPFNSAGRARTSSSCSPPKKPQRTAGIEEEHATGSRAGQAGLVADIHSVEPMSCGQNLLADKA